jgi:hypothetical protein
VAVLLYHDNEAHGPVVLSEGKVAGESTPARRYHHAGHFLEVDGPAHVVDHDVAEIQRLPGYRLATAQEQEQHHASKRKATHLTERKR